MLLAAAAAAAAFAAAAASAAAAVAASASANALSCSAAISAFPAAASSRAAAAASAPAYFASAQLVPSPRYLVIQKSDGGGRAQSHLVPPPPWCHISFFFMGMGPSRGFHRAAHFSRWVR